MPRLALPLLAETPTGLVPVDYLIVLFYMVGVIGMGLYLSRRQHTSDDYFVAARRMPWFVVGLSLVATMMSTLTYLGAPGEVIQHGIAQSAGWLALPFAFVVISFVLLPFFMRLRLTSMYEYLERRFGLAARWFGVGLFVLVLRLGWMAVIVLTASRAVAHITYDSAQAAIVSWSGWRLDANGWVLAVLLAVGVLATVYTMLGGIRAVIWTDAVQFAVLFAGAVMTLVFVARDTGTGPADWWNATISNKHEPLVWASWDLSQRSVVLWTLLSAFFWNVCTYCGDQVAVQRFFTTPSLRSAIWSNVVNFGANFGTMMLLALCGMALLTYYQVFSTEILPGITDPRDPRVADQIFPHFIAHGLPVGMSGLVVAALFAVAMSSLDSGVNSVSTVLTIDVFRRLNPRLTPAGELRLARALTVLIGLGCTGLGWAMMQLPPEHNIIDVTLRSFNCALGPLGGMFLAGMFLPHVSQRAAILAALGGLAVAVVTAWWTELGWLLGVTGTATLDAALETVSRPSPYLVTPLAATFTFLAAAVLGGMLRSPSTARVAPFTWRAVVFSDAMGQPAGSTTTGRSPE